MRSLAGGVACWMMCSVAPFWCARTLGGAAPAIHIVSRGCGLGEDGEWFKVPRRLGVVVEAASRVPGESWLRVALHQRIQPTRPWQARNARG